MLHICAVFCTEDPGYYELMPQSVRPHLAAIVRRGGVDKFPFQEHCYCNGQASPPSRSHRTHSAFTDKHDRRWRPINRKYSHHRRRSRASRVNSHRLSQWEALGTSHFWPPTKSTYLNRSLKKCNRWLGPWPLQLCKIWWKSVYGGFRANRWNINYISFFIYTPFLSNAPTGQTAHHIFTINGSNDADSRKGVHFWLWLILWPI